MIEVKTLQHIPNELVELIISFFSPWELLHFEQKIDSISFGIDTSSFWQKFLSFYEFGFKNTKLLSSLY